VSVNASVHLWLLLSMPIARTLSSMNRLRAAHHSVCPLSPSRLNCSWRWAPSYVHDNPEHEQLDEVMKRLEANAVNLSVDPAQSGCSSARQGPIPDA
jgi:hypothetical protein